LSEHHDKRAVHRALTKPGAAPVLSVSMQRTLDHKHAAQAEVPWEVLRRRAHATKAHAIANLGSLLLEFEKQFQARGGRLLWARSAEEGAQRFLEICRRHGAKSVVKGKSMLSEELELNARLAAVGIDAVETDLGEFIVQLAGQKPSHIIAPAVHLSRSDVASLFAQKLGIAYTDDPVALSMAARSRLRERYLRAGVGMTGVNFAVAESGTLVVVENEGNAGLSAGVPPVHVFLMGIEKVIARLSDVPLFLYLLSRAGTGQKLSTYTHFFLGAQSGQSVYCIVVDAGRTAILADPATRESLYCIRCGACMNVCPVYRRVGGQAYGGVYPGPIGSTVTPLMNGLANAAELPFASTLCGACQQECPVNIDLPHQLVYLRHKAVAARAAGSSAERTSFALWARAMSSQKAYERAVRLLRRLQSVSRALGLRPAPLRAWSRRRELPAVARETFKEWWRRR
jgi:L-lactate dehydrogenase complex protein LldF